MRYTVATFYQFFDFSTFASFREPLLHLLREQQCKGTVLLSCEGFNGTVAGPKDGIEKLRMYIEQIPGVTPLEMKYSYTETIPFKRLKVRLKRETIRFDLTHQASDRTGIYISAKDWNPLIQSKDITLIDARNHYEIEYGTFEKAIDPNIRTFKKITDFVEQHLSPETHPRIATFCTGGIRCEKFSRYLLEKGFPEVYQLEGGILKYLEMIPESESIWQGSCFVFDDRIALKHGLVPIEPSDLKPSLEMNSSNE